VTAGAPRAAVAVLVRGLGSSDPRVLLGRRRDDPRDPWSGHVALPGGRREPSDRDLLDTAVRECAEEAGIRLGRARAVCALPDEFAGRVTGANLPVRPWLFDVDADTEPAIGDGEMGRWEWLPLSALDDASLRTAVRPRPDLELPGLARDGAVLWGMTLRILERLWTESVVSRPRWWLDYDGTVYPSSHPLTEAVDRRITGWVAQARNVSWDEADALRRRLYHEHGNTLRGMMRESDADPHAYLDFVFDLPQELMPAPDPSVERFLRGLVHPATVFTNARADYVRRGLAAMGLSSGLGAIHDIESFGWRAKPEPELYREVLAREGASPEDVVFVDDRAENLGPARALGLDTVLVDEEARHEWLEGGDSPADQAPYRVRIRRPADLLWLARPRLGQD